MDSNIKHLFDTYIYEITQKDDSMINVISDILKNKKIKDDEKLKQIAEKIEFYKKKRSQKYDEYLRFMRKRTSEV